MIPIFVLFLVANVFYNCGYLTTVEDKGIFLTEIVRCALHETPEAEAGTLSGMLQHANSDQARAKAFVSWVMMTLDRYIAKIRKKEELPLMITYNLVLNFFFDMHLYQTQTDWNSITSNFTLSELSDSEKKIFKTIIIPYLQQQPTVDRLHTALKALYQERFADGEIKERMKAFFIRVCLPIFIWRLKSHVEKMDKNPYVVARAEQVQGYLLKQFIKEQNRIAASSSTINEAIEKPAIG